MSKILYATKVWQEDWKSLIDRVPDTAVFANNLQFPDKVQRAFEGYGVGYFMYVNPYKRGIERFFKTRFTKDEQPYTISELAAIKYAKENDYQYIVWAASDVVTDRRWVRDALKLLNRYPVVSPFWENDLAGFIRLANKEQAGGLFETNFGFEDYIFSDQAYIGKVDVLSQPIYNHVSFVRQYYPPHGGNDFECRIAQWLEQTGQRRAVLGNHRYRHIPRSEK